MSKRKVKTPEKELQDAINRIGKTHEAMDSVRNPAAWKDYLINTLGFNEGALSTHKNEIGRSGADFWEDVRNGIIEHNEIAPSNKPIELSSGFQMFFDKRNHASVRGEDGKFISYEEAGIERKEKLARIEPSERQIAEAMAYKDTFKNGRTAIRSNETGRFVKIV